jgi:benzoyl-CoA reductase subunit BamC
VEVVKMALIKEIRIDADKCSGCRLCESICSASHEESVVNPSRSRIRVFSDQDNDLYFPILAGPFTDVECMGRHTVVIKGKEYGECSFCPASCPSRDIFREPDSDIALKCDMCEQLSPPDPLCVKWCLSDALTYVEREEDD